MPRQKQQADLLGTLAGTDARLRKLERQMAITRRSSYIDNAATETTTSATPVLLSQPDRVTVTVTTSCVVFFMVQVFLKLSSAAETGSVYFYDPRTTYNAKVIEHAGTTSYQRYQSVPGSFVGVNASNADRGGAFFSIPDVAEPQTLSWELRYAVTGGATFSIKNRNFYAWVQTF